MKIFPFKAIYPNLELIASPDSFFGAVRENYYFPPKWFVNYELRITKDEIV